MNGYLLIDKPSGWTSFDVVAKVRSIARDANRQAMAAGLAPAGQSLPKRVKVGHTGTLDPLATGLLVILVGNYTKRATEMTKLDKTYQVTMTLGQTSTTGDEEGIKKPGTDVKPGRVAVELALQRFIGNIMQTPPIYSAIKINGQRAYKLAREGKEVVLEPRPARIDHIQLTDYLYPSVDFTAHVSSGTYIRSLVEDLGRQLGTGAYMSALRRTTVGPYRLQSAITLADLTAASLVAHLQML